MRRSEGGGVDGGGMQAVALRRAAAAGLAAAIVVLSAAAGTASAAGPARPMLARWHRWSRAHTGLPRFNFAAATFLAAGPREVLISGTRYEMGMTAFDFLGSVPAVPAVLVDLGRSVRAPGGRRAFQFHDYGFEPQSGATFAFDRKTLATATLDMAGTIAPSALTADFTASGRLAQQPCRLVTGGHGFHRHTAGTLAYPAFSIVTPTSPFFGTLTAGPVSAQLDFDPGCSGNGGIPGSGGGGLPRHPCPGRESLDAQTPTEDWSFDKVYGARLAGESVLTGTDPSSPSTTSESHAVLAETSIFSLPRASHTLHGASAQVFSTGNPFLTGSATFTSAKAPAITRGHTCTAGKRTRHFTTYRYRGVLGPGQTPMTAHFDTAPLTLVSRGATLAIRVYR